MKFKKVLLTALCCAMATAAFAACEKDEESSKNPSQQNPSIQTPNTQTPTTPAAPVVKTVTAEQWSQIFTAMPTVDNVTGTFVEEQYEDGTLKHKATSFLQVAGTKGYEKVDDDGEIKESYWAIIDGVEYQYRKNANGEWTPFSVTDSESNIYDLSFLRGMFEAFTPLYSQLAYDNALGLYSCRDIAIDGTEFMFIQVGFANGKLNTIAYQYEVPDMGAVIKETYTFSNQGTTQITLPDEGGNNPEGPTDGPTEGPTDGPTDGGNSEVSLLLDDLLNRTMGTMYVYDYIYENGECIEGRYYEQAVSDNDNIKHVSETWQDYQSSRVDVSDSYYTSVNGRSYVYEYSTESYLWSKYGLEEEISYNFQELADMWYWEDIQACIPYLEFNESNNHYRAKGVYVDDGEEYTIDATISVEDGRIAVMQMVLNADTWSEEITIQLNYSDPMLELPTIDDGGNEEEGGEDGGDVVYSGTYDFYVIDQYGNPLPGYSVQLSTDTNCFPPVEVDNSGWAYVDLTSYGCEEGAYNITIYDANNNPVVKFDGTNQTWGYGAYELVVYVEESAEGGDSSTPDEDMSGVWYDAFNNTFAANDFTVEMELYTTAQTGNAMYQVDDGYKAYERNHMYDSSTKETLEEYDIYYVRLETGDYVYEFDATQGGYVCKGKTLDDELFSMRHAGNVLYGISEMYDVMEYQGNDFFHMNEDYMNENFNIFATMDRIEVALMDGYVNAVRFYGYDEEGNEQHMSYIFYNYGETIVELPEVESDSTNNDLITNY